MTVDVRPSVRPGSGTSTIGVDHAPAKSGHPVMTGQVQSIGPKSEEMDEMDVMLRRYDPQAIAAHYRDQPAKVFFRCFNVLRPIIFFVIRE